LVYDRVEMLGIFDHAYPVEVVGLQGLSISQPL
jgi:hypothetical protein